MLLLARGAAARNVRLQQVKGLGVSLRPPAPSTSNTVLQALQHCEAQCAPWWLASSSLSSQELPESSCRCGALPRRLGYREVLTPRPAFRLCCTPLELPVPLELPFPLELVAPLL